MTGSSERRMTAATWMFVEALGIPDSPMRRVLFELASLQDDGLPGDQLALSSTATRALLAEFKEQFPPKSPLRQQVECMKAQRELRDDWGIEMPDARGDDFELQTVPTTVAELTKELGYGDSGRAVRSVLRRQNTYHDPGRRWDPLTPAQVNYVRAHLPSRVSG